MTQSFTVRTAADASALADALGRELQEPPADPFAELVVAVEGPGTARWLAHRLAKTLGISAGIAMPALHRWLGELVDALTGVDPETDPWRPAALAWRVMQVLEDGTGFDDSAVRTWTERQGPGVGRLWLARHVSAILDDYRRRRPDLLRSWNRAEPGALRTDLGWQFTLWQHLVTDGATARVPDPVSRTDHALRLLDGHEESLPPAARLLLPEAMHAWAPNDLDDTDAALLAAVAAHRPVTVWFPGPGTPDTDDALPSPGSHLQGTYASRHVLQVLARAGAEQVEEPIPVPSPPALAVHACPGPQRQVEVLRDVLCALLESEPSLQPRDIAVLCVDPSYFPLVQAAFTSSEGASGHHPAADLPIRLADPGRRDHNELLVLLVSALTMGRGRATATELSDFLAAGPVAARFGLDGDQVARAAELVRDSGVRWGMNVAHRDEFGLGGVQTNTWMSGLNRLLVGVAMSEDGSHAVRTGYPLDDVSSSDIPVVGAIAEVMARLIAISRHRTAHHTPSQWVGTCREILADLTAVSGEDAWQLDHAWAVLGDITRHVPSPEPEISLDDLLDLLEDALHGRVPRSAFRTGEITVCSLAPLRHVPHRVVCVVGLDEGAWPRPARLDGDNMADLDPDQEEVLAHHQQRQLFTDAVASARDHLVLTYTGTDPSNGRPQVPSALVTELLESARTSTPSGFRDVEVVRHPLQPFDPAAFTDQGGGDSPCGGSFDPAAWSAARVLAGLAGSGGDRATRSPAGSGGTTAPAATLHASPFAWPEETVALDQVIAILRHPAREFLRHRAHFTRWRPEETDPDALPIDAGPLEQWASGNRVLQATLSGDGLREAVQAEALRGTLPPGPAGNRELEQVHERVAALLQATAPIRASAPHTRHLELRLPSGTLLQADVTTRGHDVVHIGYGSISPAHRLDAWLRLLALAVAHPDTSYAARLHGRNDALVLTPPDTDAAMHRLDQLVGIATDAMTHPIPLPIRTSEALARSTAPGSDAVALNRNSRLRQTWERELDGNWEMLWGSRLSGLTRAVRPPGVPVFGDEPTWIADLARTIWSPLASAEVR